MHDDLDESDAQLIARANRGEGAAFEQLYERYRAWILATAYRVTLDREAALDVLQDVVAYWLAKFPGFVLQGRVKSFLFPVVRHVAIDVVRRRRRAGRPQGRSADEARNAVAGSPVDDQLVSLVGAHDLDDAMARLPAGQREVLILHFADGLTLAEIAVALEVPLGTVKSRLGLALAGLRGDGRLRRLWLGE